MSKKPIRFRDVARSGDEPLASLDTQDLIKLDPLDEQPPLGTPRTRWLETYDFSLDGFSDFDLPKPKTPAERDRLVQAFLSGLEKLFDPQNNWTFPSIFKLSNTHFFSSRTSSQSTKSTTSRF